MSDDKNMTKSITKLSEADLNHFLMLMNQRGLNITKQRINIAKIIFGMKGHHSVEEIYLKVHQRVPSIGQTTVYRTIKLLCEVGLMEELQVGDGMARYEVITTKDHHDHLVCKECGKTVEFHLPDIEKVQQDLARSYGFTLLDHHHLLLGICDDCKDNPKKKK